jgi:prophage tail gpP-like protein
MTFEAVARKVLSEYPVGVQVIGELNNTPFEKLQNQTGELIWDFLERIARPRGIVLGTDSFNNFLLIGDHAMPVLNTELIEGNNIKSMQCVFHKEALYTEYKVVGQTSGNDQIFGSQANEQEASWGGTSPAKALLITPAEQPVKSVQELLDRAHNESIWHEYMQIEATVVVQGWFRDDSTLWWPLDNVFVWSPMCPLKQVMKIQHVTFEQNNNGGTFTTLDLVQPWALKDRGQYNPTNDPNIPSAPGAIPPGQNIPPI